MTFIICQIKNSLMSPSIWQTAKADTLEVVSVFRECFLIQQLLNYLQELAGQLLVNAC
jgi:hypothetical protein